jgi:hypothetical protein
VTLRTYDDFLAAKAVTAAAVGIANPSDVSPTLFPFQRDTVKWALRQGRAAIFFGCGLGKTGMQLAWADAVARHTARPVLILAPLAVSHQTKREGDKFNVPVTVAKSQEDVRPGVNVTNYERLGKFTASEFGGVVLDESGILKSYMGATKQALVESFSRTPFRLCCTATPAPNDHMELGNHCEFLGVMSSHEMLARWFMPDQSSFGTYVIRGHAVESFWNWVASWARCAETPSDIGYADDGFILPELSIERRIVDVDVTHERGETLFRIPEMSATSVHKEKRRTSSARAQEIARLVAAEPGEQWLIWTDTNYEAEALAEAIPEVVEVSGDDSDEIKEARLLGFVDGSVRTLLTKSKIAGFGLNLQNCARMAFVGPSFSYEAFYQNVRRAWRFGQTRPVKVYITLATTEVHVWDVVSRKAEGHSRMKDAMRAAMFRAQQRESAKVQYVAEHMGSLPTWLRNLPSSKPIPFLPPSQRPPVSE